MPVRWGVHQIPQYHNTAPIQLSGRTSSAVFTAAQIRPGASWQLDNFLRPQGAFPPGFYLLREGWVHCPAPEAPLTRGMPTGPRVFLTNSGRVWATALRPVPPKKRPSAIHARKVGRASKYRSIIILHQFNCQVALRRLCLLRHSTCVLAVGRPQGAFPPGLCSGGLLRAWGAPNKGNADGAEGLTNSWQLR